MPLQPRHKGATDRDDRRRRDAQDNPSRGIASEQLVHGSLPYCHLCICLRGWLHVENEHGPAFLEDDCDACWISLVMDR